MANPFRNTCRIADQESYPGSDIAKTLSIEFLPDGFVFSVMDAERYRYLALEAFESDNAKTDIDYAPLLADFYADHPLFCQSFKKTVASVYSPYLVLVPGDNWSGSDIKELYATYAPVPEGHSLRVEPLQIIDACGIFPVPDQLLESCETLLPECQIRSYGVSMIKNVLAAQKIEQWGAEVIIHIKKRHAEILLLQKEKLIFYRSFQISCFDDMLYYLFYVLEQYQKQADKLEAVVIGELPMDSQHYSVLASFFKKLTLPAKNDVFTYSPAFSDIPDHYYFNLLNLNTCE